MRYVGHRSWRSLRKLTPPPIRQATRPGAPLHQGPAKNVGYKIPIGIRWVKSMRSATAAADVTSNHRTTGYPRVMVTCVMVLGRGLVRNPSLFRSVCSHMSAFENKADMSDPLVNVR
jgi:hypothetical protein